MKSTQKKKDLGIFYTPKEVVDLIIACAQSLKDQEDIVISRWDSHKPVHYPSIIDPACGEGIFLKQAVSSGLTRRDYIFGADLDPSAVNNWESTSLLHEFEGDRSKLNVHFINQNGLLGIAWSDEQVKLLTHIKGDYIRKQQFDFVLGNPPYGGIGIGDFDLPINIGLLATLGDYKIWQKPKTQQTLLDADVDIGSHLATRQTLEKYPIEVLFIERFLQLAKDPSGDKLGGKIAIVLPEGIFANSTLDYVRKYITAHAKVLGIISLPRDTFKNTGTNAKTSILILEKTNKSVEDSYPIFLASLTKNIPENFAIITNSFKEWIMNGTTKQIVDETNGLMIRVDKTIVDLNSEKPSSRWDPSYWHPKYDYLQSLPIQTVKLLSLLVDNVVISADTVRESRGEKYSDKKDDQTPINYYTVNGIMLTGFDMSQIKYGSENAYLRLRRSCLDLADIAIARSGTGSLGKSFIYRGSKEKNIVSDLYILRIDQKKCNPHYIDILLKTKLGRDQIQRNEKGVSGQTKITSDMIENFIVPIIRSEVQGNIESEYKKMSAFHDKAMAAKSKGDTSAYESNLKTAEDMLKDLVAKTEAVIRGEREDVV